MKNKQDPPPMNVLFGGTASPTRSRMKIKVDVNRNHCHLYGICEQEAPEVFELSPDGRLEYKARPDARHMESVRQAVRLCPMQAITIEERHR